MSETTPERRPDGTDGEGTDHGPGTPGAASPADGPAGGPEGGAPTRERDRGRRVPRRVVVLAGVLLLVVVAVIVVIVANRDTTPEVLEPEVVTLPLPTPTIEPVDRPEGTAFQQALPSTVLDLALTEVAEDPELMTEGALESHRAVYGDGGGREVVVLAGQWATAEEAAAVLDRLVGAAGGEADDGGTTDGEADDAEATEPADGTEEPADADAPDSVTPDEGVVEVAGEQVGRYVLVPGDGTETVWWTNGTALLRATGPTGTVMDVHTAFSL